MRLDKYLKVSRLIKRREVAKEMIDRGMVSINSKVAKPSNEIKVDDIVIITSPSGNTIKVKIKEVKEFSRANEASNMYEVIE
jgi:ribosomal 50S subunit-recycling heat shock protein